MTCPTRFQRRTSLAIRSAVALALLGAFVAQPVDADVLADCPVASDAHLGELRGGLNVGPLIANFAIERVVHINGDLVARTLLVVDFSRMASGGMPDLRVIGDLALLIQVGPGNSTAGSDTSALPGQLLAAASAEAAATATDGTAMADQIVNSTLQTAGIETLPVTPSASNSGVTSTSGVSAGSQEQFGAALVTAVDAVTGGGATTLAPTPSLSETAPLNVVAGAAPSAAPNAAPIVAADSSPAVIPATANQALAPALTTAGSVPASMTARPMDAGPAIVIFNIPDGNTLATAIQNSVAATRIETQTIISATLNSLAPMQSGAFADALRQQILRATGP